MSYSIGFICYYNDLFRQEATLHIFHFYLFRSKEPIDYINFTERLIKGARDIFYDELYEGKTEEQALQKALNLFKKKIIKP